MRRLSPEHRRQLEAHAPLLHYDPQDAFRATSAATMTDNPPNSLRRARGGDGSSGPLAVPPSLSLATLTAYPGGQEFRRGDHLAAGPDVLGDARRMQADPRYPHCAYGRVLERDDGWTWLQYWLWYYDNPKTFLERGRHEGDWELVQVGLGPGGVREVTCSQHGFGETRDWAEVTPAPGDPGRPCVYVAPFSHANYFEPKTKYYFPAADHPTDEGVALVPEIASFEHWERWRGRWGADVGLLGGRLRKLGGASPPAPIEQTTRWSRPGQFADAARRPTTSRLKSALWWVGRRTYPVNPEITAVELDGRIVIVRYRVPQPLLRRTRHLLITVHEAASFHHMLLSQVVRLPGRGGSVSLELPAAEEQCLVWASGFNAVGQRSNPVGPFRGA